MIEDFGKTPEWQTANIGEINKLESNDLHIWWLPLRLNPSQKIVATSLLSDVQHDKYMRRRTSELKNAYLAGRYYLLHLLGAYTHCRPDEVKLSYSRLNKPSLSHNNTNIEFNFTDTTVNGVAQGLFAFSKNRQVGVDLEALTRRGNFPAITRKKFTQNEIDFVTHSNTKEINPERFLAIWTRKEAFGKATGVGINFKMNERDLASDEPELNFVDQDDQPWRLLQFKLGNELIASVVHSEHKTLSLHAYQLPPDTLER